MPTPIDSRVTLPLHAETQKALDDEGIEPGKLHDGLDATKRK